MYRNWDFIQRAPSVDWFWKYILALEIVVKSTMRGEVRLNIANIFFLLVELEPVASFKDKNQFMVHGNQLLFIPLKRNHDEIDRLFSRRLDWIHARNA